PCLRSSFRHGRNRDLELAEHRLDALEVACLGRSVGSGRDDDRVLPVAPDQDQRDAGRLADATNAAQVDASVTKQRRRLVRERIVADCADEAYVRTEPGRGQRLVRALAAGNTLEGRVGERLPRPRQPLRSRDEVEVDRPDDRDARVRRQGRADPRARARAGSRVDRRGRPRATSGRARIRPPPPPANPRAPARARPARDTPAPRARGRSSRLPARAPSPTPAARPAPARRTTSGPRPAPARARASTARADARGRRARSRRARPRGAAPPGARPAWTDRPRRAPSARAAGRRRAQPPRTRRAARSAGGRSPPPPPSRRGR